MIGRIRPRVARLPAKHKNSSNSTIALAATFALFAIWGLAHRVYEAIAPQFSEFFHLTASESAASQSVFTVSLFVLALPAALFLRRFGYKLALVFGLSSFSVGSLLLYPAITQHEYFYFISAIVVLGAGWAWLETSANPLVVQMGSPETAVRRLNFAQSCYPLGVVAGFELGRWLTQMRLDLPPLQLAQAVVRPYVIVGLCVLFVAFLVENLEFPTVATERSSRKSRIRDEFGALLSRRLFRFGMGALAAYILAHTSLWVFTVGYVHDATAGKLALDASELFLCLFLVYGAGRITGTALMAWIEPNLLLAICAGASVLLTVVAALVGGTPGAICLVATNFFMSIMFPTIFATSVRGLGDLTKSASGLLVTGMGIAASLAPLAMNVLSAISNVRLSFVLPCACFAVVLLYSEAVRREQNPSRSRTSSRLAEQQ
jgi:FHS family L-fucose permease-like MFS transporter